MNIKFFKPAVPLISAVIAALPSAVHAQCDESYTQLKVSYKIDQDGWDAIRLSEENDLIDPPFLAVRPSGNSDYSIGIGESKVTYDSFDDVIDFDMCVPRDGACLELVVAMFPMDSYDISWDGQRVEQGQEFSYWNKYPITSTELGDFCAPTCDESTEALFEYNYWTGGTGLEPYRAEDAYGNTVLGCDNCRKGLYYSLHKDRACLRKDSCYQFLTGSGYQWIAGYHANAPTFSILFDGKLVGTSESWLFKQLNFGGNCPCNQNTESTVELFLTSDTDCEVFELNEEGFNWELSLFDPGSSAVVSSGLATGCGNKKITHEKICVPRGSCASFNIKSASGDNSYAHYSLTMDGVIYRSGGWDVSQALSQVTNLGRCTVDALCDQSKQALFEVELQTASKFVVDNISYPAINYYDVSWLFDYTNPDKRNPDEHLFISWDYISSSYDDGSVYRTIECVPDDECVQFHFNMTRSTPIEEYTVKRNGLELGQVAEGSVNTTAFGEPCVQADGKSTSLPIAMIVGTAAGACILVVAIYIGWSRFPFKRRKQAKNDSNQHHSTANSVEEEDDEEEEDIYEPCEFQSRGSGDPDHAEEMEDGFEDEEYMEEEKDLDDAGTLDWTVDGWSTASTLTMSQFGMPGRRTSPTEDRSTSLEDRYKGQLEGNK